MQPITFLKTPKHLTHLVNADSSTADGLSYTRFTHGESSVAEGRRRTGAGFVGDGWSSIFCLRPLMLTRGGARPWRKGMRAAPLPRCTVTGVTAVVSVQRVLGVPAAQPAAASVGARLGMGEDIVRSL